MWGCPYPFLDSSGRFEGTGKGKAAQYLYGPCSWVREQEEAQTNPFLHGETEHGTEYSWLGASPAPPAADAPAQGSGQATGGLANMRMSFSRSEDISLLIVVDMLSWRLFVSLETATKPGWNSTPTKGVCGHGEQGTTLCPPFAKVGLNVTKQHFGILKYLSDAATSWEMLFALSLGAGEGKGQE